MKTVYQQQQLPPGGAGTGWQQQCSRFHLFAPHTLQTLQSVSVLIQDLPAPEENIYLKLQRLRMMFSLCLSVFGDFYLY